MKTTKVNGGCDEIAGSCDVITEEEIKRSLYEKIGRHPCVCIPIVPKDIRIDSVLEFMDKAEMSHHPARLWWFRLKDWLEEKKGE